MLEILLFFILVTVALVLAIFWLGVIVAGLPAALVAVVLWQAGLPLWASILIGILAFGYVLDRWEARRKTRQAAGPRRTP